MKRNRNNPTPNISFFGDNLDRLLAGQVTDSLKAEVRKTRIEESTATPLPAVAERQLVPTPHNPIVLVMYRDVCNCGQGGISFGFIAERTEDHDGTAKFLHRFRPTDKPEFVHWMNRDVPYCHNCIPCGLNTYDRNHAGVTSGRFPGSHPNSANGTRTG